MFSEIDEIGVRDGANLAVAGYDFAPTFSIWTTIEECLNPPVIWERDRGWFTTAPFSEPEVFDFPAGIGPVECVNVEHEEVLLIPRWVEANRVTFKYGLGAEFIGVLQTLHKLGLDRTDPVRAGGATVSPRDVVAACLPDPAALGDKMTGLTCAGTWVTGTGTDGAPAGGLPAPRGRQRLDHGRVRIAGRGLADGGQPGGRAGTARLRRVVRHRRARAGGTARRSRSSTCSVTTAPPGPSTSARRRRARPGALAGLRLVSGRSSAGVQPSWICAFPHPISRAPAMMLMCPWWNRTVQLGQTMTVHPAARPGCGGCCMRWCCPGGGRWPGCSRWPGGTGSPPPR